MSVPPARSSSRKPLRAPHDPDDVPGATAWYRRVPMCSAALTLLVLITAAFAVSPVRDAVTLLAPVEAHLGFSDAYLALAPISDSLDHLTLLTVPQHIALVLWAIAFFTVCRVFRWRRGGGRVGREIGAAALFLVGIVAVYAAAAVLPRPMAELQTTDLTVIPIDFHAHTRYSHDGRAGWDPADVRAWHDAAGFGAAYITDHRTLDGAREGIASNASQAGEGVQLLQGLEAGYHGEHVNILGAGNHFVGITTPDLADVDDQTLALASLIPNAEPVLIETLPGKLSRMIPAHGPGTAGVRAIELIDGSPRGLTQSRRERASIIRLADSLNLALIAGSDNHGWGRATPGWTMMRLIDWRSMDADSLAQHIERVIRVGGRGSTKVFERRVADGGDMLSVVFSGITVPWRMFTTLGGEERMAWLIWIWVITLFCMAMRGRRVRTE